MKDYYNILGLEFGASPSEIKKAYFKLIRQYNPESNPERFMEIREAYEFLKNSDTNDICELRIPNEPLAQQMMDNITVHTQVQHYKKAITLCQEALQSFPDAQGFRYMLGLCQLENGNTGNAIKNFECLVNAEPENRHYQQNLANAYLERGFTKKAIPVFKKAYALGCQSNEFILTFSMIFKENGEPETARDLLWAMLQAKQKKTPDVMEELLIAYEYLYIINASCKQDQNEAITDSFYAFLQNWTLYLEEKAEQVLAIFPMRVLFMQHHQLNYRMNEIMTLLETTLQSERNKHTLALLFYLLEAVRLQNDSRMCFGISLIAHCLVAKTENTRLYKYTELDAKLCMLEELPEVLENVVILEAEYPLAYQMFAEFIQALRENKNLKYLKDRLLSDYARMEKTMPGGMYYTIYPPKNQQSIDNEWPAFVEIEEPFVRSTPKIGRNEPCPCGSGKKYKHCCGK